MVLHTVGAAVWVGGLLTLVIIRPLMRKRMVDVLYRYSTLALVSFIVVTLSGVVRAYVAVGDWSALATPYGILVLAKTALLALLGPEGTLMLPTLSYLYANRDNPVFDVRRTPSNSRCL